MQITINWKAIPFEWNQSSPYDTPYRCTFAEMPKINALRVSAMKGNL